MHLGVRGVPLRLQAEPPRPRETKASPLLSKPRWQPSQGVTRVWGVAAPSAIRKRSSSSGLLLRNILTVTFRGLELSV